MSIIREVETVKGLFIQFEFENMVHGIRVHCNGTKGYDIVNDDGSLNPHEYTKALNRVLCVLKANEETLITFGNNPLIGSGVGVSYGRLIRNWSGDVLSYVIWDGKGNLIEHFNNDGNVVPERSLVKCFLGAMIKRHRAECGMEA